MLSSLGRTGFAFLLLLIGCTFTPSVSAPRNKLFVSDDGLYRVTGTVLRNAGINLDKIDPATLQLFRSDHEIAIRVQGERDDLTLEFYGQANDAPYSPFGVYWLRWGVEKGKRMRQVDLAPAAGAPKESFQDTVRVAHPSLYVPQVGNVGDSWFWKSMAAPITTTLAITLPSALTAAARLRVNLRGMTEDAVSPNHHITAFFNDVRVADEKWAGRGNHSIDATVPAAAVRPGENSVRLTLPGDTRAQVDIVLLNSIEVTYTRRFSVDAQQDALNFQASAGTWRVDGFSADAIDLYDVTDPFEPSYAVNVATASRAIAFSTDTNLLRRWLAVGPKGFQSPARIAPMTAPDLRATSRQADYVIITYPDFVDALKPLVDWREKHGLKVSVVTTNEVYDEFSFGAESPLAIRAFIDFAYHQWVRPAPRYVLLVGKASYDYLDYLKGPNKNLVPTFLVETPNLGQAASDNWFVALNAKDDRPALAIGRIPAKTADQVARVVGKTMAFESSKPADWQRRALFIADDKDAEFNAMADALAAQSGGMQTQKIYLSSHKGDVNATRAEIIREWNSGASMITYIGHGSINTWAAGPLFSVENLNDIRNGDRLPVLFTPTCLDGFFYHPKEDSLAEDLLFKNDGGIVAGLVPTGLSFPEPQKQLMRALFDELFASPDVTLGEAIMRAKQKMPGDSPDTREVIDTFGLLGDPALRYTSGN